jgi:alkylation response protein AidB-like acyl-CoA dehydrogenase
MRRTIFTEEHEMFRDSFRQFVAKEISPNVEQWEKDGIVPRELFAAAGASGFLGTDVPEQYGGGGVEDFRYNLIIGEEVQRAGSGGAGLGLTLHNDVCLPYFLSLCTEEQKQRWLPGICSGELITAVAMTEPGIGSDLASMTTTAIRDGETYVVNGSKTFITNGINADLIITAVKTDPSQKHKGMSLVVIERGMEGFERGRNLEKVGLHSQDTAELFFTDVRVPKGNLLGNEGEGFVYLMTNLSQERLSIAVSAVTACESIFEMTLKYAGERTACGKPIGKFQHNRFVVAEMATDAHIARVFVDDCLARHVRGELDAKTASMAKWWTTELQNKLVDQGVQMHGGYGYMLEYPIARLYADTRVSRIYGGTSEVMRSIIAKSMGL